MEDGYEDAMSDDIEGRPQGTELLSPFPWFGGKRLVAEKVWARFGNVATYNEPFAGSLAVLLARPHEPGIETVNDLDCHLANFWRALKQDPDGVAAACDWPVNEADLHARHLWLIQTAPARAERMKTDPNFYDRQVAGWWVWGQCMWIGAGWCEKPKLQRPNLHNARGIECASLERRWQGGGSGVHAPRLTRRRPHLKSSDGVHSDGHSEDLYEYLGQLSARLRRVRVCCGDWTRILTPSVTTYIGVTGVFLDPPYDQDLRDRGCYAEDRPGISADVRTWALDHGDDPQMRIALCGYEGEHVMPDTWEVVSWKAQGGYSHRTGRGRENSELERIWFSPHCLKSELPLFAGMAREEATL